MYRVCTRFKEDLLGALGRGRLPYENGWNIRRLAYD